MLALALLALQGPPHPTGVTVCGQANPAHVYAYTYPNEFLLGLGFATDLTIGYFAVSPLLQPSAPPPGLMGTLCVGGPVRRLTAPWELLTPSKHQARASYLDFLPGQRYYVQAFYRTAAGAWLSDALRVLRP